MKNSMLLPIFFVAGFAGLALFISISSMGVKLGELDSTQSVITIFATIVGGVLGIFVMNFVRKKWL